MAILAQCPSLLALLRNFAVSRGFVCSFDKISGKNVDATDMFYMFGPGDKVTVIPSGEVAEASAIPVGCSSAFETFETPARTERLSSRAVPMDKDGSAQTAYRTGYNVMNSRVSDGTNVCSVLLTFISLLIISLTCPFSLFFCIKVRWNWVRRIVCVPRSVGTSDATRVTLLLRERNLQHTFCATEIVP
ncbi:hypothetical protein ISCGN_015265 [Ixodes scapularis]